MKLCKIIWNDAENYDKPWASLEDIKEWSDKKSFAESVGWILLTTKLYVVVVADADINYEGDSYGRAFKIPRKIIQKIIYL